MNDYAPGRITLALNQPAPAGAALVVSENYYPGWRRPSTAGAAAVGRADFTLIGVGLPAGARESRCVHQPAGSPRGRAITLAVLGASVLAMIGGVLVERRRRV